MRNETFKLLEQLDGIQNSKELYFELPYEKRIENKWYNRLVNKSDEIAKKINDLEN